MSLDMRNFSYEKASQGALTVSASLNKEVSDVTNGDRKTGT